MAKNYFEYERDFCTVTDTYSVGALQQNSKKMLHFLDLWKNNFAVKQDQKPVSEKTEFFE